MGDAARQARNRSQLRELTATVQERRGEMTSVHSKGISEVISKANAMHDETKNDTRASAIDASLISLTASLGAEQAGNLEKVNPESWVLALGAAFGIGGARVKRINWKRLGEEVREAGIFANAPGVTFLLGSYTGPPEKKQRERKQKDRTPAGPVETAASVGVESLKEQEEKKAQNARIKAMMETMHKHTDRARSPHGINLFHLLLHPTSFSQTVENLFDLSFQVKQGYVSVQTKDGCPYVSKSKAPVTEDYQNGVFKKQNILTLDVKTWRKLVDRWCTGPPLLPDRADPAAAGSSDTERPAKARRTE